MLLCAVEDDGHQSPLLQEQTFHETHGRPPRTPTLVESYD